MFVDGLNSPPPFRGLRALVAVPWRTSADGKRFEHALTASAENFEAAGMLLQLAAALDAQLSLSIRDAHLKLSLEADGSGAAFLRVLETWADLVERGRVPSLWEESMTGEALRDNLFPPNLLAALAEHDDQALSTEPEECGPWSILPVGSEWGVFREGDDPAAGDVPAAVFPERARALLFAVALPAAGREPGFVIQSVAGELAREVFAPAADGFARAGSIFHLEDRALDAFAMLDAVARSPRLLADLLEAAGSAATLRAGRILYRRLVSSTAS